MTNWPVVLEDSSATGLILRPLKAKDAADWRQVRAANRDWLARWEATAPEPSDALPSYRQMVRRLSAQARAGQALPFAIEADGRFVGQLTVSGISWGSLKSASIGYWIDQRVAGRGLVPTAVAMVVDYCFFSLGLHRIEINIRPENTASLRVVEKLGFRDEGVRVQYLHIAGDWRDHRTFALVADDVPGGLQHHWHRVRR